MIGIKNRRLTICQVAGYAARLRQPDTGSWSG